MKEKEGMKNLAIAAKLFPNDFKSEKTESAERKISHYYKRYTELVNGGYNSISNP